MASVEAFPAYVAGLAQTDCTRAGSEAMVILLADIVFEVNEADIEN